jgi:hypothetical protein
MAKLLLALFLTAMICVTSPALAARRQRSVDDPGLKEANYEENDPLFRHPLLNEVLADLDDTTADMKKYNPLILRHVENNLRSLAERVKEKRMLICSRRPQRKCDVMNG